MSHLRDDHLQELLDGNANARRTEIYRRHIRNCPRCRRDWDVYRKLKQHLEMEPGPPLSEQFTDRVLAALPRPAGLRTLRRWVAAGSVLGLAAAAAGIGAFHEAIRQALFDREASESPLMQFRTALDAIVGFIARVGGDQLVFFGIACMALLLIGVVDRKIIQPRMHRSWTPLNGLS